jgi:hypothetical protein
LEILVSGAATFCIVTDSAPEPWVNAFYAAASAFPQDAAESARKSRWNKPYFVTADFVPEDISDLEGEAGRLWHWLEGELKSPRLGRAKAVVAALLPNLPAAGPERRTVTPPGP